MEKFIKPLVASAVFLLAGCVWSAERMNQLSVGMTKAQVIDAIGSPRSSSAQGGVEYLNYVFTEQYGIARPQDYFVRLIDGKVESYGKKGDFNSTKDPTLNVNIKSR